LLLVLLLVLVLLLLLLLAVRCETGEKVEEMLKVVAIDACMRA
jgi:hypothetical protein